MLSLIYFLIVLGVLVIVHEFGHFIVAKLIGVRVEKFSIGFGPKIWSIKKGETEYIIAPIPLGGYIKMGGEEPGEMITGQRWEFLSRSVYDRFKIIVAGPVLNYIFAFLLLVAVFMVGTPVTTTEIGVVMNGYPAKEAGLMVGDKILAVDGKPVTQGDALVAIINKRVQGSLLLTIERGGNIFKKEVKPIVEKRKMGFGAVEKEVQIARIGIQPAQKIEKGGYGFFGSIYMGAQTIWQITVLTYKALGAMIIGKLSMREMAGPVGIFMITAQAAKLGLIYLLNFMAILSASLAIFNLLPFPVLDGGHIFFLVVEKLRGKPISMKTQEKIMNVGWSLLILFMVLIFYSDIMKFGIADKVMKLFKH